MDEFRIATTFAEAAPLAIPAVTAMQTNQLVRVSLNGLPTRSYAIEGTTNFQNWSSVVNGVSDTNGLLQFDDTNFFVNPGRFFRGVFP